MNEIDDQEINKVQHVAVEVVKYLQSKFPNSNLERIHVLMDLLEIEFKALSFINVPAEALNLIGQKLIQELHADLTELWEGDKTHRKVKGTKDAKDLES